MQAVIDQAEVGAEGELILPRLSFEEGTAVEVIILVQEPGIKHQDGL